MPPGFRLDLPLLVIAALLLLTGWAFVRGHLPYPYGFIVLLVLLLGRIVYLRNK